MYSAQEQTNQIKREAYFASLLNEPALLQLATRMGVDGPTKNKALSVNVLKMHGQIIADKKGALNIDNYNPYIERAFASAGIFKPKKPDLVVLDINSPGGTPSQSELIANEIRRHADATNIPVIACVQDMAASGGYWIACAADQIYAPKTAIVGSIGVIAAGFGMHGLLERFGIERRVTKAGKAKGAGDMFAKQTDDDKARLQALANSLHDEFKHWVSIRRAHTLIRANKTIDDVATAEIWLSQDALKAGLIDGIGALPNMLQKIAPGKHHKVKILKPRERSGLRGLFGFNAQDLGHGIATALIEHSEQGAKPPRLHL